MGRQDIQYHTPAEVRGYLAEARQILAEQGIDEDSHEQLLIKLVDLLQGKSIVQTQPQPIGIPAMAIPRGHH